MRVYGQGDVGRLREPQDVGGRTPAAAAWESECAGWLALGTAPEAHGWFQIGRTGNLVWARPAPGSMRGLPVMLMVERAEPDGEGELRRAVDLLRRPGVPLYVSLPPEGDVDGWRDAARRLRFRPDMVQVLMTCRLSPNRAAREPARYDVREALADEDWWAALGVMGEVYEDPDGLTAFYNPRGVVRLFLARVNGEPAAAAALWPFRGVAGIYSLATRRRFRGLGLAYAVVERILRQATEEGFPLAALRTSGELIAFYMRHGFGVSGQIHRYRLG